MAGLNFEIDSLKQEISRTDSTLNTLYCNLGSIACTYHRAIDCPESNVVFEEICSLVQLKEELEVEIDKVRSRVDLKNKSDLELKNIGRQLELNYAALGAVAAEVLQAGTLPEVLLPCMEEVNQFNATLDSYDQKMKKGGLVAAFYQRAQERLKGTLQTVFMNTGKRLYAEADKARVPGARAEELYEKLNNFSERMGQTGKQAPDASEVENADRVLKDYTSRNDELAAQIDEKYTEYGKIISATIDEWLDEDAPEELKNACTRLRQELRRRERQNLNLNYYDAQKQINVHKASYDQYASQVSMLEQQKATIEKQIEDLSVRMQREKEEIDKLRGHQEEFTRLASNMERGSGNGNSTGS